MEAAMRSEEEMMHLILHELYAPAMMSVCVPFI